MLAMEHNQQMINPETLQWNITKERPPENWETVLGWWAKTGEVTIYIYLKSDDGEAPDLWMPIREDLAKERWDDYVRATTRQD